MLPLSDVKVIEFCQFAAGPYCGMVLGDMGADVIKVEPPGAGDDLRNWSPRTGEFSTLFISLNRNKRSVALDLKQEKDQEIARRLCLSADVVLENYRPGTMAKFGLDYTSLSSENPDLIYCSVSAYGQDGPRAREGGFDLTVQAISGVMSVTGEADGAPVKCGVPISDFGSSLHAAFAITAALRKVDRGGGGDHIDVPMMGATLGMAALQTHAYFGSGENPGRMGSAHHRNAPYQAFKAKDGYFAMAAGNDKLWRGVCDIVERPDLPDDPRFITVPNRSDNQVDLCDILEVEFARFTKQELLDRLAEKGVPSAPINSYSEALADPQSVHMGWVEDIDLPGGGTSKTVIAPIQLSGEKIGVRRPPPLLGEHNDEVIAELDQNRDAAD
ncbi:MAG: CoA transferase [Rhodospirillaceae bacterium]|nr:CoA transferase [Rhodospirillaceae bacterium]MBT5666884.1 CoA transferase [Rhodospirillaceae bacterium]MBT5810591.1 CoA transferase [Rhodospirillaceae bacterium]